MQKLICKWLHKLRKCFTNFKLQTANLNPVYMFCICTCYCFFRAWIQALFWASQLIIKQPKFLYNHCKVKKNKNKAKKPKNVVYNIYAQEVIKVLALKQIYVEVKEKKDLFLGGEKVFVVRSLSYLWIWEQSFIIVRSKPVIEVWK